MNLLLFVKWSADLFLFLGLRGSAYLRSTSHCQICPGVSRRRRHVAVGQAAVQLFKLDQGSGEGAPINDAKRTARMLPLICMATVPRASVLRRLFDCTGGASELDIYSIRAPQISRNHSSGPN
jgi:hypothetical protein